jgi:cob(I)alamin adenosyltransferase
MIFVFTGNGKGKTTAAIGQAIRVLGNGKKVAFIQFIKSPRWPAGEETALRAFGRRCKVYKGGKGFVGIMGDTLPRVVHQKAAQKTWIFAKNLIRSKKFPLVVLDEICIAFALGFLEPKEVIAFFKSLPDDIDVICTGRGAPGALLRIADLVTEMKEIKHPFQKGIAGKKGREY